MIKSDSQIVRMVMIVIVKIVRFPGSFKIRCYYRDHLVWLPTAHPLVIETETKTSSSFSSPGGSKEQWQVVLRRLPPGQVPENRFNRIKVEPPGQVPRCLKIDLIE